MPKKLKNQIPPIVKAALILVAGFFAYKLLSYFFCLGTGADSETCVFLTFYGPPN